MDEGFLKINGQPHYLWCAGDPRGNGLDIGVTSHRDKQAAQRVLRTVLKRCPYVPRVLVTDKLASYGAAQREWDRGSSTRNTKA